MRQALIIAGFGGQGVVKAGVLLATAAMLENKHCTHFPSYGAEMRGGTTNCSVIISQDEIASPIINQPDTIIVMNAPSLIKFEPRLKSGGLIIYNSSLISNPPSRTDVDILPVPANEIAEKLGATRYANMVIIGAYIGKIKVVQIGSIKDSLPMVFPKFNAETVSTNSMAMEEGRKFAEKYTKSK